MRVLIDDVRRFVDGRECVVWRTSTAAIAGLEAVTATVDELWLDYDLGRHDDLRPVLGYLERRQPPLAVLAVHIVTTNPVGGNAIKQLCDRLHYRWERHYSLRGLLTAYPLLSDPLGKMSSEREGQ
jgi:hypothetical protein